MAFAAIALAALALGRAQGGAPPEALPLAGPERDEVPPGDGRYRPSEAIERAASADLSGFDRERLWSGYDDWEPVVVADPSSSNVYQLTTRLGGPPACPSCAKNSIIFRRSRDGGVTWDSDRYLILSTINQYDPQIRVDRNGSIYVAFLLSFRPGVTFMRSDDRGKTWSAPISFTAPHSALNWNDRPALSISTSGRDVYIAFNHSDSWIVASHDGGRTFAAPQQTSHDHRYYFHSAGTVAPNGSVSFAAQAYVQNYRGNVFIDVIHSADGGATWQTVHVDTGREPPACRKVPGCYFGFLGPEAGIAADARGNLLLAYNVNDHKQAPQHLYARTSSDGVTWSARAEISGTGNDVSKAFPAVAAGPSGGDFRVVWMDDRLGAWDTWYRRTLGASWSEPVRLSNRKRGAAYKGALGFGFPYGDYLGVSVDSRGRFSAIWGAGPNYDGPGGTWYTRGP